MLQLDANEVGVIQRWAEHGAGSPFPQEQHLLIRLKQAGQGGSLWCTNEELEVVKFWAEKELKGRYGQHEYMLEMEHDLLEKIDRYIEHTDR
jgi:hypothetical protein